MRQTKAKGEGSTDLERFSHEVYINWAVIAKLIRRRCFQDNTTGDALVNVKEVDYLCTDAFHVVVLSSYLPWVDFALVTSLG
jgi:hypothetical protein